MTTKKPTGKRAAPRVRTGRPSMYSGKIRSRVITFTMTEDGHCALERLMTRSGRDLSRSDVLERVIREAADRA